MALRFRCVRRSTTSLSFPPPKPGPRIRKGVLADPVLVVTPTGPEPLADGLVSELIERVVAHHWALSSMPAHALSRTVVFQLFPAASTVVHFLRSRVPAWGHGEESGRRTYSASRSPPLSFGLCPGLLPKLCLCVLSSTMRGRGS